MHLIERYYKLETGVIRYNMTREVSLKKKNSRKVVSGQITEKWPVAKFPKKATPPMLLCLFKSYKSIKLSFFEWVYFLEEQIRSNGSK